MGLSSIDVIPKPGSSSAGTTGNTTTTAVRAGHETAADFESVRSLLFGIAYRRLGRAVDAEDVVQDVWVRWQGADRAQVRDRVAFLVAVTTRVALNTATSARARREVSVGGWSPERDPAAVDPAGEAERGEALAHAVRLLMERLSPVERAVYVLREAFAYPFSEIGDMLDLSEVNARQLAVRARRRLTEHRYNPVDSAERDGLLKAFLDAARAGDMAHLIDLLQGASHPAAAPMIAPGDHSATSSSRGLDRAPRRRSA
ncbi:sigma-70 family RNA polymerase sigma factor [Streptomyces sp. NPDC088350]|uniref:sigma-70 family RNA polymerase sigma factor n=1 Tax=Streptomyces sp. NPDC088350 TaxID=3365854 RepID=UPI00380D662A